MKGYNLGNPYLTNFRNNGRYAGSGIIEDNYSEESGGRRFGERCNDGSPVRFPNDNIKPEELNGEVIIVKPGKRKDITVTQISHTEED